MCKQISKDAIHHTHVMWSLNVVSKIMFIIALGTILVSLQNLSTQVLAKKKFRSSSIYGDRDSLGYNPPGKRQYMIKCSFRYSNYSIGAAVSYLYSHRFTNYSYWANNKCRSIFRETPVACIYQNYIKWKVWWKHIQRA